MLPRVHLFEFEDQSWFPGILRDFLTDYLRFVESKFRVHETIAPVLKDVLETTEEPRVVDLCSGAGGMAVDVHRELTSSGLESTFLLTDLYPNVKAFENSCAASDGRIEFASGPVDARDVPDNLDGIRLLMNGFHHFRPEDAGAILANAVRAQQPIAIFELSQRTPSNIIGIFLVPLLVWCVTPFIRPFRWSRLLWTYLLPAVPLICFWDGFVSQLRAYTQTELKQMTEHISGDYDWVIDQAVLPAAKAYITYLTGSPKP